MKILLILVLLLFSQIAQAQDIPYLPKGSLGEFRHGSLCTAFYSAFVGEKKTLVDIQLRGNPTKRGYSAKRNLIHAGIDILPYHPNSVVSAVTNGIVHDIIDSKQDKDFRTLGYMVIIKHKIQTDEKDTYSIYLHLKNPPEAKKNERIFTGQIIGIIGNTGASFGPHLHLEIRHFPERFYPGWGNIYGEEKTANEDDFKSNWVRPQDFFIGNVIVEDELKRLRKQVLKLSKEVTNWKRKKTPPTVQEITRTKKEKANGVLTHAMVIRAIEKWIFPGKVEEVISVQVVPMMGMALAKIKLKNFTYERNVHKGPSERIFSGRAKAEFVKYSDGSYGLIKFSVPDKKVFLGRSNWTITNRFDTK